MKPFLLILTAFFIQSCYTVMYTPDQPSTSTIEIWLEPPPPEPCPPPASPVIFVPVATPVTQPAASEPVRLRTNDSDRGLAGFPSSNQDAVRTRTPAASSATTANQNNQTNQSSVRERPASPSPGSETTRPRQR